MRRLSGLLFVLAAIGCAGGPSGPPVVSLGPLPSRQPDGKPGVMQAGVHRKVDAGLLRKGKWDNEGWKLVLRSPGAKGLRLHFTAVDLPAGKLVIRGAGGAEQIFEARGPHGDGDFWTGLVTGDSASVEWRTKRRAPLPFQLRELSHLWTLP
jgi:hypothetical protein